MKISIVTYYKVASYGAMLQAYALQSYLQQRGHRVEFIKTTYLNIQRSRKSFRDYFSLSIKGTLIKWKNRFQSRAFSEFTFAKRLIETKAEYSSLKELQRIPPDADLYLVGSDQIWSPVLFREEREEEKLQTVLLDFGKVGVLKASYAASFGTPDWYRDDLKPILAAGIERLDKISVREASGCNIVQRIAQKEVFWSMDPTLLHDAMFYIPLVDLGKVPTQPYLFEFMLFNPGKEYKFRDELLRQNKLHSIVTPQIRAKGRVLNALNFKLPVDVELWLAFICKAGFVLTDSYHGLAFALIFHRPFIVLLQDGVTGRRNDRIVALLTRIGLESRIWTATELMNSNALPLKEIEWDEVDQRLLAWREESKSFLQSIEILFDTRRV